ncbi:MAG: Fic family protein [Methanomassiliicoccaceae archaeon]|nr:Fic family protein [Methanomassiliicoccaceae archaeon]
MKRPHQPPANDFPFDKLHLKEDDECLRLAKEFNSNYLHWDDIRRRDTKGADPRRVWAVMSFLRDAGRTSLQIGSISLCYSLTDSFQHTLYELDRRSSGELLFEDSTDQKAAKKYAVSSLMEEAIASSQIEGAVTTTRIAKTMLREGRKPKGLSEKMIFNNYRTMQFIKENKDEKITPQLILEIHKTITDDVLEDRIYEGRFRDKDDIVVQDSLTGEVFHEPPKSSEIPTLIDSLCDYINSDDFVHPLIKGAIIHFLIAYIHPFVDGNGRLARSIHYWYSLREGYRIFEYLAVSRVIKEHRGNYDRAYLLSETDGNDITYFIKYLLKCIEDSLGEFMRYVDRKNKEYESMMSSFEGYDLNMRQISILSDAVRSGEPFSISEVQSSYQVSYQTATNDIRKMESLGLLKKYAKDWNRVMYIIQKRPEPKNEKRV